MANKNLFRSVWGALAPRADTVNEAGGSAYALTAQQALTQYAMTGCLNSTFYASADEQLAKVIAFAMATPPEFIAKLALFAREKGYMKDLPAFLCAYLSAYEPKLFEKIFPRVIDNGKMLRNFVQIMRSGAIGRKSLGTLPKRMVLQWLAAHSEESLFRDSVGNAPSLADVIKMVHPKPETEARAAMYGYLLGKTHNAELLPSLVKEYEAYKVKNTSKVPAVPFQMLTALELGTEEWCAIARNASWQTTRMNLNTFMRHGVFKKKSLIEVVASRLKNVKEIKNARAFPYQLLMAYRMAAAEMPTEITEALQDAMEIAIDNVPKLKGRVVVCPDVSGSMGSSVTGYRKGATSAVRCIDVAALVAASIMRMNARTKVIPFEHEVVKLTLNPRDSVMTNADKLAKIGGGGTNCSAPLVYLNEQHVHADLVVFVSDNQSWIDSTRTDGTATMQEWGRFKARNPKAQLVCIDIQPYASTQAAERGDVLNIGGFSDQVFEVIAQFSSGALRGDSFVELINKVEL